MTPTIGRIVHYVADNGEHWPAIVTRVWGQTKVNLQILPDMQIAYPLVSVNFDEFGAKARTWHWPEKES